MTIVEFLLAYLAEQEAVARAATPGPWTNTTRAGSADHEVWTVADSQRAGHEGMRDRVAGCAMTTGRYQTEVLNAAFIAANDPAYVLADIAAKRAIIELHQPEEGQHPDFCGHDLRQLPCPTLRALAAPISDRPGYDPAWAPT